MVRTLLVASAAGACTQPTFQAPDAAEDAPGAEVTRVDGATDPSRDSVDDAGDGAGDAASALPPAAATLRGRYARRSVFFADDASGGAHVLNRGVELALLEFADDGQGGIALHTQLCDLWIENDFGVHIALVSPDALPDLRQPVTFSPDGRFNVEFGRVSHGFAPTRFSAEGCAPTGIASRIPRFSDQDWSVDAARIADATAWNTGHTCACPAVESDLPNTPTDCRLTDPDGDRVAGVTAAAIAPFGLTTTYWSMVLEIGIAYDAAMVATDGSLTASERRVLRPGCVQEKVDGCAVNRSVPCVADTSELLFVRLPAGAEVSGCAELRASATTLFALPLPPFPKEGCVRAP